MVNLALVAKRVADHWKYLCVVCCVDKDLKMDFSGSRNFYNLKRNRYKRTRRTPFSLAWSRRLESHAARTVRMLSAGPLCWVACFLIFVACCFCWTSQTLHGHSRNTFGLPDHVCRPVSAVETIEPGLVCQANLSS